MEFIRKYALREMRMQPGWFTGLFLTDSLLVYLFGLLLSRILQGNDGLEIFLHCILLAPLLLALTSAVLAVLYRQKQQNHSREYGVLRELGMTDSGIIGIQCLQTVLVSVGAVVISAPLSLLTMRMLRQIEGNPLWQSGWRNRSLLPYFLLAFGVLLAASLLCCVIVFRKKTAKPFRDRWSKRLTMQWMLQKPRLETYTRIRRNRLRYEGVRMCGGLALLHLLPMLFCILLLDTAAFAPAYTPDTVLYLSAANAHPAPISHMLVTRIEQVEGVVLESTFASSKTSPPAYRSVTFRLTGENWQESVAAVRRIVSHDRGTDLLQITVPLESTLSANQKQENLSDLFFVLLLFISSCGISLSGTGILVRQYLQNRQEELGILTYLGLSRRDCFRMLWKTIGFRLAVCGIVSVFVSGGVWLLYDWITFLENHRSGMIREVYHIPPEYLCLFAVSGILYVFLLLGMAVWSLRQDLRQRYPKTSAYTHHFLIRQ